jgi:hypothetical protein
MWRAGDGVEMLGRSGTRNAREYLYTRSLAFLDSGDEKNVDFVEKR